jgi:hypothetical protein
MGSIAVASTQARYALRMKAVIATVCLMGAMTLAPSDDLVAGTSRWPIPACLIGNAASFRAGSLEYPCESYALSLYLPSLKAILEPQGVRFDNVTLQPSGKRNIFMQFPKADTPLVLLEYGPWAVPWQSDHPEVQPDRDYVAVSDLFQNGRTIGLPFALIGWNAVRLEVGTTSFMLSKNAKPIAPVFLYLYALLSQSERLFPKRSEGDLLTWNSIGNFKTLQVATSHRVAIKNGENSVFLVLTRENVLMLDNQIASASRVINIAHSDQNGIFEFASNAKTMEFVTDISKLEPNQVGGLGRAVVVKFSGRLDVGANAFTVVDGANLSTVR